MSSLPLEVLMLVFSYLEYQELLQCQLTDKQWRKASLTRLYSNVGLESDEEATHYVRTISNSPQLGKYLECIAFDSIFDRDTEGNVFDVHGILDAIIRHCPNITRIKNFDQDFQLWTQLMHAATQGQLSYIKFLPESSTKSLGSYIYTALSFKNSLVEIYLCDDISSFGPQLARLGAYQTLCDQIDQFKNLECLSFSFDSDKYLNFFDGLIDKCHNLKKLKLYLNTRRVQPQNELESSIRPRPDVHTFECNWKLIDTENQLDYVMRKFPNLKSLTVKNLLGVNMDISLNCSGHTLIEFVQYAISIPNFQIGIDISTEDLLNIWTKFIKTKTVNMNYYPFRNPSSNNCNTIKLSSKNEMELIFLLNSNDDEPPHIQFFSRVGETIKTLNVDRSNSIPRKNGEVDTTIDWLFDILQLCPFMEEISLGSTFRLSPSCHTLRYSSVKKLIIHYFNHTNSIKFLDSLSLNLPNLRELSFGYFSFEGFTEPIAIHIPRMSLDLLTWKEISCNFESFKGTEVYIKLETDAGVKFYVGIENKLTRIQPERYLFFSTHTRFDIKCKYLKELRIQRAAAPESDANLVF